MEYIHIIDSGLKYNIMAKLPGRGYFDHMANTIFPVFDFGTP